MKVQIAGFAGAGKSTLARKIGEIYNVPVLHIDTLHFLPNWVVREDSLMERDIEKFLKENDGWVIDGNYYRHTPERFDQADKIIYLNFNRFTCLMNSFRRINKNRNNQRPDMAKGCIDKPSFAFSMWILFGGRAKKFKNRFKAIETKYPQKVVILRNKKEVDKYVEDLKNERERENTGIKE
ncbi:MAG: topology modulation protein [Bacillales bacterium]|nr:topology modulation protein [Bacillales bacterium]